MTANDLQRAALVLYAAREVGPEGSLDQMKAVCHIIRNRTRAGWHDSNWLTVMEQSHDVAGNAPLADVRLDLNDRRLILMARDVDDIFYGNADDEVAKACGAHGKQAPPLLYWYFMNRPPCEWFLATIIRDPANHRQRAQFGFMLGYE